MWAGKRIPALPFKKSGFERFFFWKFNVLKTWTNSKGDFPPVTNVRFTKRGPNENQHGTPQGALNNWWMDQFRRIRRQINNRGQCWPFASIDNGCPSKRAASRPISLGISVWGTN